MIKRLFDIFFVLSSLTILWLPLIIVPILIKLTSKGPILYWSDRIGKDNKVFSMPKFRSMRIDTPALATHLLTDPSQYLTPIGGFLRKSSLDEIPQLWCILKGDMSIVGPRPALFNQDDLISLRTKEGIHKLLPGLTGLAQISGRDELSIPEKVLVDKEYLENKSFMLDLKIIFITFIKIIKKSGVSH
jgi:O-antigen biosynthesis protein WbqP